jgi:hypothetical protein
MTAPAHEFTAEQVIHGIHAEGRVDVVPGLIRYLAAIDPTVAQEVYDLVRLGLDVAQAAR